MICDHAKECGNTHCTVGMPHEELVTCRGGICGDKSVHCIPVPATEDESRAEFEKWMEKSRAEFEAWWEKEYSNRMKGSKYIARKAWQEARKG